MLAHIVNTLRRTPCRDGHLWTDFATPVACSRCGRTRTSPR